MRQLAECIIGVLRFLACTNGVQHVTIWPSPLSSLLSNISSNFFSVGQFSGKIKVLQINKTSRKSETEISESGFLSEHSNKFPGFYQEIWN